MVYRLEEISRAKWEEFQHSFGSGSFFHRWEWQNVIEKGFGVKVNRLGIFDDQGELKGILPLVNRKMSILKLAGSPLSGVATPHSGPLGNIEPAGFLEALELYAKQAKLDYMELGLPKVEELDILEQAGYKVEILKSLDLPIVADEQCLWEHLEVRCRNAVRKAEKSGVEVLKAMTLEEWLEPYYEMSVSLYDRQNKPAPFTREYFSSLWQELYDKGDLVVIMARLEGRIIAGGIFPIDRQVAYYLDGVSEREYNKFVPNNLVQWEFLKIAAQMGITLYDMVGANIPSIAKFKKSFGSKEREYLYAYRNCTLRAKAGRWIYSKQGDKIKKLLAH